MHVLHCFTQSLHCQNILLETRQGTYYSSSQLLILPRQQLLITEAPLSYADRRRLMNAASWQQMLNSFLAKQNHSKSPMVGSQVTGMMPYMWGNPTAALPKASNKAADADMHACPAIWQDHLNNHFPTQLATSARSHWTSRYSVHR